MHGTSVDGTGGAMECVNRHQRRRVDCTPMRTAASAASPTPRLAPPLHPSDISPTTHRSNKSPQSTSRPRRASPGLGPPTILKMPVLPNRFQSPLQETTQNAL